MTRKLTSDMADKNISHRNAGATLAGTLIICPLLMVFGIMQLQCFPYSSLKNISYGIALSMAFVSAIWIICTSTIGSKTHESAQQNLALRFKRAGIKLLVDLLVVSTCALITGLFSWMVLGDAVYFSSEQPHEYVTTVTKRVSVRGCRSSVEFFEENLNRTIIQCPDNDLRQPYQGQLVKIKTRIGPLGVRIMSVRKM